MRCYSLIPSTQLSDGLAKNRGQFPASFTLTESSAIPFVFVQLKKLSNGSRLISTAIVLIGESSEVLENQTG